MDGANYNNLSGLHSGLQRAIGAHRQAVFQHFNGPFNFAIYNKVFPTEDVSFYDDAFANGRSTAGAGVKLIKATGWQGAHRYSLSG